MNALSKLAADLGKAAAGIENRADRAVHSVAGALADGSQGSDEQIVVTFPANASAHLGGVSSAGVYDDGQGSTALADADVPGAADDLSSDVLAAGVSLIVGGS